MPNRQQRRLAEKTTATIAPQESTGDRYRIRIISAGDGSSATYPADVLERDAAAAWPAGTRMRANHDGWFDFGGDVQRLMAKTTSTPEWDAEEQASFAEIQVAPQYNEWFRTFADVIGVSIQAAAEVQWPEDMGDEIDAQNDLLPVVTKLLPATEAPYNSIDFVEAPGANGRIVAALEGLRKVAREGFGIQETSRLDAEIRELRGTSAPAEAEKGIQMDEEQLKALLAEHKRDVLAGVTEALKPAEPKDEKPALSAVAEAVVKAGLSDEGRAAVYEAIERGESHEQAIERETKREEQIAERIKTQLEAQRESDVQRGYVTEAGGHEPIGEEIDDVFDAIERATGRKVGA